MASPMTNEANLQQIAAKIIKSIWDWLAFLNIISGFVV